MDAEQTNDRLHIGKRLSAEMHARHADRGSADNPHPAPAGLLAVAPIFGGKG